MEALEEGESRETVAARFKIGRTTLWEWQQRRKETGDFQSKKLGNGDKVTDWNKFTEFAKKYGGKTLSEMAKLWSNVTPISLLGKQMGRVINLLNSPIIGKKSSFSFVGSVASINCSTRRL